MCIHSAFLGTLHILVVSPAATGSSAKLRERHEGDDAVTVSNVRSGLFKVTPTVEMKKEKVKKRLNHRSGI